MRQPWGMLEAALTCGRGGVLWTSGYSRLNEWTRGYFLHPVCYEGAHTATQQTPSQGHQVTHCGNRLWQQQLVPFEECFPFLHPKSLKSPPWGIGKKEGERERETARGGGRSRRRRAKERERVVERTERLWMERMESLESVGLYLIPVARQPVSNRGERDGGQERDHTGWRSDMWIDQKRAWTYSLTHLNWTASSHTQTHTHLN